MSRLRAGLAISSAVVSLVAGAQAAQACTEPALGDLPARGTEGKLVRFKLTGLTPGSEYVVRVAGRERKSGVATEDRVSRRFRMPKLGQDRLRVLVDVVVANDACENGPWKFSEKITYEPAPEPPAAKPAPQPTPTPTPTPAPQPNPSPPAAPSPPPAPSITKSKPKSQPAVPAPAIPKAVIPKPPPATEPPKDARAWLTPADPYQKRPNTPPKLDTGRLARTDLPADPANSTAALLGLAGAFLVLVGIVMIAWTRFRRYDDARLDEVLNPEGKLPTHLDPKAKDLGKPDVREPRKLSKLLKRAPSAAPAAAGVAAAAGKPRRGGQGRGAGASLTPEQRAAMTDEEFAEYQAEFKRKKKREAKRRKRAELPTLDPTASDAPGGAAVLEHGPKKHAVVEQAKKEKKEQRGRRFRRRRDSSPPDQPTVEPAQAADGPPTPAPVPPVPAPPPASGQPDGNAAPPDAGPPPERSSEAAPAPNGHATERSHREEVEAELQRILNEAGLNTEVDGILADAKAEAERQGVPIDSDLMLRALCEGDNGAARLSDSAKGELESRFKRIVAEERGESHSPGS